MISGRCIVVGFALLVVIATAQYTQAPPPAPSTKGCGIPIAVNAVPNPDPARMAGRWWKHRQSGIVTTNQYLEHVPLNRTGLPFTTTPAVGMILRIQQYNNANDTQCVHRFFVGLYGVNGQCPGKNFQSVDDYAPAANDLNVLYLDYDSFYILYACRGPNYKSGMCDRPVLHVITRNRPDKMTAEQLKAIDDITDSVLAPYCFSAADIPQQLFTDGKPVCELSDYTGCAERAFAALNQDIRNGTSN